jgi:hypothetical protein
MTDMNGIKEWHLNGELHREDGPAVAYSKGEKWWYMNGELHREDGPSIEYMNGTNAWYLNGEQISEEEHSSRTILVKHAI